MTPGEQKTFTLTMPDDYRDKDVAGKPAEFTVTLHWVKERELPALDDDFAQQVGEYADVAGAAHGDRDAASRSAKKSACASSSKRPR